MNKPILHMPDLTIIHDGVIMALWKEKFDTFDIARKLGLRECQVANRLTQLNERLQRDVTMHKEKHA